MLTRAQRATLAGLVWVAVGIMLIIRGYNYSWVDAFAKSETWAMIAIALGLVGGAGKGFFVLSKASRRIIARIESMPGRQPFWQTLPLRSLLLIPIMIGMGIGLRLWLNESHPQIVLGVYFGIGAALLASSIPFFKAAPGFSDAPAADPAA